MVNVLNDNHHKKPKLAIQFSKSSPLTRVTDNPLDDFTNSDDQTNSNTNPTVLTSPPLFYTKRPNRPNQMTRFELFLKRKQFHQSKNSDRTSTLHSSPEQNTTLPNYSTVNTSPTDKIVDNTPVTNDTDNPVKVYSKTN